MMEHRCGRCDQVLIPGQAPPLCLGGRYHCDPRTARRVVVPAPPCRCQTPVRRIAIIPLPSSRPVAAPDLSTTDGDDRVDQLRTWVRELGRMPGRDAVKKRFGVGSGTANWLREQADQPTIRAVR